MAQRSVLFLSLLISSILLAGCSGSATAPNSSTSAPKDDPDATVVATYGDSTLTLSEFERAYVDANKNVNPAADSLSAYEEFLEQYVNYRLKVRAARAAGLDTLPSVQQEIASYRQKMARPKIMRSEIYQPLVRSLYERQQTEVDVSHILKRVPPDAPPKDTLKAYQKMQAIADSIRRGVSFGALAYRHSEDPSAQKKGERGYRGRLGYLRAGQIVEPFEDRMYAVPPDSVSEIFRTKFGYHILKVHDRRQAQPPIRLSHIMIRSKGNSARPRKVLDSLRTEVVQNDANFAALAKKHSQDRRSASRGGDLGKVQSTQSLPPSFREAVAELDTAGAVSGVVKSQYGHHLIKLTDRDEQPSFQEAYDDLKEKIADRPRVDRRKKQFARQVRSEEGTSVDTSRILAALDVPSVDTLSRPLLSAAEKNSASPPIATLGDSTYTLDQLGRHVMQTDGGAQMSIGEVIEDFLNDQAFRYATARLEERDSSFAATMKEYREGLLVFQFMQDSVWSVASQDSAGLRETYEKRQEQYRFPDRIRTFTIRGPADSLLSTYQTAVPDTNTLSPLLQKATADSLVTVDTIMVTDQSPEVYRGVLSVEDGATVGPVDDDGESLVLLRDTLLPARPKTFEEARSSVIRDYQNLYEDEVLSRLRRRYDVKTYPSRLSKAFDEETNPPSSTP